MSFAVRHRYADDNMCQQCGLADIAWVVVYLDTPGAIKQVRFLCLECTSDFIEGKKVEVVDFADEGAVRGLLSEHAPGELNKISRGKEG